MKCCRYVRSGAIAHKHVSFADRSISSQKMNMYGIRHSLAQTVADCATPLVDRIAETGSVFGIFLSYFLQLSINWKLITPKHNTLPDCSSGWILLIPRARQSFVHKPGVLIFETLHENIILLVQFFCTLNTCNPILLSLGNKRCYCLYSLKIKLK